MQEKYDIIIAGAGPAGAQCARYFAENSKYSVLLLDRTQEIGEPKKSTSGTFMETMNAFNLPKKVTMCKTNSIVVEGPTEETEIPIDGYVLEFGKLKKFLVEQAIHHGADLKIGASVTKPILQNGKIKGLEYHDYNGLHVVNGKCIIDATGPNATLATQMGIRKINPKCHGVAMEFEMERLKLKYQKSWIVKFDRRYCPGGWAWICSTAKNHAKVGMGWVTELFKRNGGKGSQVSYLMKWINEDKRLRGGVSMEMHAGDAYVENVTKKSTDNFMAVGDTVCTINPLGEGVRQSMYSGTFAAQAAIAALKKKDTSARQLSEYDKLWKEKMGSRKVAYFSTKRLYALSNKQYDKLAKNIRKLDEAGMARFVKGDATLRDMMKLIPL